MLITLLSLDKIKTLGSIVINYMINYSIQNIVNMVILLELLNSN